MAASEIRQHYLPSELIQDAEKVFRTFCHSDGRTVDRSQLSASASGADADRDQPSLSELRLNSSQLRLCLEAMGLVYMEIQVKDMLYSMLQTADTATYNQAICLQNGKDEDEEEGRQAGGGGNSGRTTRSNATTVKTRKTEGNGGGSDSRNKEIYLTFSQFMDLITLTLEDCDVESEFKATFQAMDLDQDGKLGIIDLKTFLTLQPTSAAAAAAKSPSDEEIRLMLEQVDWDNDGKITLPDLQHTLDVN